ncbi:uncharacterized protein SPSK_04625 [Sporothrix schenckii 1099-18]|uniref:Uncharacterized protein n=1 Tax=Sporothrix schenckii 1099-18 TaxID=1397361 RepID=A0A0F2M472_SPOSC|nr:uncharacterized protein SPSK_04625 [Sporothrix schenckii 1099-18]KJR82961.1 hypothetical protein SPSK_04625 [Sporothrix schenckii 1099-18]
MKLALKTMRADDNVGRRVNVNSATMKCDYSQVDIAFSSTHTFAFCPPSAIFNPVPKRAECSALRLRHDGTGNRQVLSLLVLLHCCRDMFWAMLCATCRANGVSLSPSPNRSFPQWPFGLADAASLLPSLSDIALRELCFGNCRLYSMGCTRWKVL